MIHTKYTFHQRAFWCSSTFGRLPSNERRWYRPPHHMQSSLSNPDAHLEQSLVATLPINSGGQCNQTSLHPHDPHENLQLSQGACSLWWKHQVSKVLLDLSFHAMQCATPQGSYSSTTATDSCKNGKHVKMSYDVSRHHVLFWNFSKYLWLASKSCRTSGSNSVTLVV